MGVYAWPHPLIATRPQPRFSFHCVRATQLEHVLPAGHQHTSTHFPPSFPSCCCAGWPVAASSRCGSVPRVVLVGLNVDTWGKSARVDRWRCFVWFGFVSYRIVSLLFRSFLLAFPGVFCPMYLGQFKQCWKGLRPSHTYWHLSFCFCCQLCGFYTRLSWKSFCGRAGKQRTHTCLHSVFPFPGSFACAFPLWQLEKFIRSTSFVCHFTLRLALSARGQTIITKTLAKRGGNSALYTEYAKLNSFLKQNGPTAQWKSFALKAKNWIDRQWQGHMRKSLAQWVSWNIYSKFINILTRPFGAIHAWASQSAEQIEMCNPITNQLGFGSGSLKSHNSNQ